MKKIIKFEDENRPHILVTDLSESKLFVQAGNDLDSALLFNDGRGINIEMIYTSALNKSISKITLKKYKSFHADIKQAMFNYMENLTDLKGWSILICNGAWILLGTKIEHKPYFNKMNEFYMITMSQYKKFLITIEAEELEKELKINKGPKERKLKI